MSLPTCETCGARIHTAGETRCWRHRGRRRLNPTRGGHGRPDPVTEATAAAVRARDGGCVAGRVGFPDSAGVCEGRGELDHIDNGGLGKRGPSTPGNLVTLCTRHHRWKTEHASTARPLLIRWVNRKALERLERSP